MDIQFGNPKNLYLIGVVVASILAMVWGMLARRQAVARFASVEMRRRILPSSGTNRRWISATLVLASLTLLTIALFDIRWGKTLSEVPQKGIEVMFVLDVSRSMLAEDATPNRLNRAKQQIKDMVGEMAGDRVGLIAFGGESKQVVPLTSHYDDFQQSLDSVGPQSVRSGGSKLGAAIASAASGFLGKTNDHKAMIIFTDGEDQESNPIDIARKCFEEQGIRIFTVGLGDMDQGARIPETESRRGGFVQYQGQQVWSKLNGQILQQIATITNGAYIPAGTRRVDMADVYHRYVSNVEQTEFETAKINTYTARFQWFAVPALAFLVIDVLVTSSRRAARELKGT